MECGLHAPEGDGGADGRLDAVRQGFALLEHGLEFGAQLGLDADLRDDGGLRGGNVLRLRYGHNSAPLV